MSTKKLLKVNLLLALWQCDGQPMPEAALIAAAKIGTPDHPTDGDIRTALATLEGEGFVQGLTNTITGRSWTLTVKGQHEVAQLV